MTKSSLLLAALFSAHSAFAQSVELATPKQPVTASPASAASFNARCATCSERIDGKVSVERDGIRFCCSSWSKPGSKVALRCPYSFNLPISGVTEQYLETNGPAWHVVSDGADYSFVGTDAAAMKAAFERLRKLRAVPSHLAARFQQELTALPHPAAVTASAECQ